MSDVNFEVDYRRAHGVHEFELRDGMPVTVLSLPTWEEYVDTLAGLPDTQGYIASPELITSPVRLEQISDMKTEIEARAETVRELSRNHSYARLLLGTARFTNDNPKPFNGVTAFMSGQEIGWQGKAEGSWGEWEHVQSAMGVPGEALSIKEHRLLVCAELIAAAARGIRSNPEDGYAPRAAEMIPPSARSLVVMACWGVPFDHHQGYLIAPEDRYRDALERCVSMIFERFYRVEEVVVADRAIVGHGVEPFNAHFRRK